MGVPKLASSRSCSSWLCRAYLQDPKALYCQTCGKKQKHPYDDPPMWKYFITNVCASCGQEQHGWHESLSFCSRCGTSLKTAGALLRFGDKLGTKSNHRKDTALRPVDEAVLEFLGGRTAWDNRQRIVTPKHAGKLLELLGINAALDEPHDAPAIVDVFVLLGDYESAWEYIKAHLFDLNLRVWELPLLALNIRSQCKDTRLDGMDYQALSLWNKPNATPRFRRQNVEAVAAAATPLFDRLYDKHGKNLLEFYADKRKYTQVLRLPLDAYYWTGSPFVWRAAAEPAMQQALKRIEETLRKAENSVRDDMGVPRIGEGWVEETMLFYRVKESFPRLKPVQHGHPVWLGQQHLDVWIPSLNLGIEFHGEQHFKPVAYFGGEDAFLAGQERDQRKERLCRENGCHLIAITHGYDWDAVRSQIEQRMVSAPKGEQT